MKTLKQIFASMWDYPYFWAASAFWLASVGFLLKDKYPQWALFLSLAGLYYLIGSERRRDANRRQ